MEISTSTTPESVNGVPLPAKHVRTTELTVNHALVDTIFIQ